MSFAECSYTQVSTEPGPSAALDRTCMCCLEPATGAHFVNLKGCYHVEILTNLCRGDWKVSNMVVCLLCHRMLEKINLFRQQVQESLWSLRMRVKMPTAKKVNLLQQIEVYNISCHCDTQSAKPSIHLHSNNVVQIKLDPLDSESYVSDDMNIAGVFIKEENDSDEKKSLLKLKDVIIKKENENNKAKMPNYNKVKNIPKEISNVENTLSDNNKYGKIVDGDGHQTTMKLERSEAEKQYMAMSKYAKRGITYKDKIEVIRLTFEQVVEKRAADMLKADYVDEPYKCNDCIKLFVVKDELDVHNKNYHYAKSGYLHCALCKRVFKDKGILRAHLRKHYNRFACVICKQLYITLNEARTHYNDAHGSAGHRIPTGHNCTECGLTFPTGYARRYHYNKYHKTWQCDDCKKMFPARNALISHIQKIHDKGSSAFPCKECGKTFKNLVYLSSHSAIVHRGKKKKTKDDGNGTYYCAECKKMFASLKCLNNHLKRTLLHMKSDDGLTCEVCSRKFTFKKALSDHMDFMHRGIKRHTCQHCDKAFPKNKSLRQHINDIHLKLTKPKDKICHICGQGFATNQALTVHMRRHTAEQNCGEDL